MDNNVELANHRVRNSIREDLTEAGFTEAELTEEVITSYMPARLEVEVESQERIQRMYMDRASAVPAGSARDMLLSFAQLREVHIDSLRFLLNHRYS